MGVQNPRAGPSRPLKLNEEGNRPSYPTYSPVAKPG